MWQRVDIWFRNLQLRDPVEQRQAPSLVVMIVTVLASVVFALPFSLSAPILSSFRLLVVFVSLTQIAILFGALTLIWRDSMESAIRLVIFANLLASSIMLGCIGLARSEVMLLGFFIPILFAAFFGHIRLAMLTGVISIGCVALLVVNEPALSVWFGYQPHPRPLVMLVNFAALLAIVTLFVAYFAASLQRALRISLQRETELEQLRDSLEQIVSQRTGDLQQALANVEQREATLAQAINDLYESESRQRAILEAIPDAIYRVDMNGICIDYKPEKDAPLEYDPRQIIGQNTYSVLPHALAAQLQLCGEQALATGKLQVLEFALNNNGQQFDREARMVACGEDEILSIVRDITERKRVERLKNEFVAVVSHELRTPLTAVRGALGLVVNGVTGPIPEQAGQMLRVALNNSERLLHLISDILDIERLESGALSFSLQPLSLGPLLEQAVLDNQGYAVQYHVELRLHQWASDVHVVADYTRLQQVMANLLSNACKFSPPHSTVHISMVCEANRVRVSVSDSGAGIPEAFQPHVFEKFSQADASNTRQQNGAGLGLSIAKLIVERCGGTIGFETNSG